MRVEACIGFPVRGGEPDGARCWCWYCRSLGAGLYSLSARAIIDMTAPIERLDSRDGYMNVGEVVDEMVMGGGR